MATFAKSTFNAAMYALARPTYPRMLFDSILSYHERSLTLPGATAKWKHALDLGCGTGQATAELLRPQTEDGPGFSRVIGLEPSAKMITEATNFAATLGERGKSLSFVNAPAEELGFLPDSSVDMVIAGELSVYITQGRQLMCILAQAAHWFDWERLWPELTRVLRHGGTAAFWVCFFRQIFIVYNRVVQVYSDMRLPQYPQLTPMITEYLQGSDPETSLGPYWEPGRKILNNHLLDIAPPSHGWDDLTRVFFTGNHHPDLPEPLLSPIMQKKTTWGVGVHGYLRTFSSLLRYHEAFPDDINHPEGDIAARFLRSLMIGADIPLTEEGLKQEVTIEWPLALVLARKELDPTDPWRLRNKALVERVDTVREPYNAKMAHSGPPTTVEETAERMEEWIEAQQTVLTMVEEELESLPEVNDQDAAASVLEDTRDYEEKSLSPSEQYERGRLRYLELLDGRLTSLSWRLTFKESFDFALNLANQIEVEVPSDDIPAGVAAWITRMKQHISEIKEGLPDLEDPEVMAIEQLENLSQDDAKRFEKVEALQGILQLVEGLVETVNKEPIGNMLRELYVSAGAEVTSDISFDQE
ncbi:S-adenosyl-L-methionine-dependent methyltransferase [Mycena indigotica]|uniref:S-adenosyl-L-methionine-dependent methyltransferase n=1 Tax=Mycena indigotica TaxID=2126181 RepID=A0A8H6T401_9AGAR|nr:S-adenosyl-L-methionine-dependent methyltransferase [Mycena indigotica]KAF7309836.1 S-adenosyl-L-methionine-dependent methyltransferase [Mycena indigotica]